MPQVSGPQAGPADLSYNCFGSPRYTLPSSISSVLLVEAAIFCVVCHCGVVWPARNVSKRTGGTSGLEWHAVFGTLS
jgi:hypothetical protein